VTLQGDARGRKQAETRMTHFVMPVAKKWLQELRDDLIRVGLANLYYLIELQIDK
jgi:hypothetical protein